jgi:hypothetical protein
MYENPHFSLNQYKVTNVFNLHNALHVSCT